jgi:hypothetical protein
MTTERSFEIHAIGRSSILREIRTTIRARRGRFHGPEKPHRRNAAITAAQGFLHASINQSRCIGAKASLRTPTAALVIIRRSMNGNQRCNRQPAQTNAHIFIHKCRIR